MASRRIASPPILAARRIVACQRCGGRRRTLVDSAEGLRGLCIGCGVEVSMPLATEEMPLVLGRGGQMLARA